MLGLCRPRHPFEHIAQVAIAIVLEQRVPELSLLIVGVLQPEVFDSGRQVAVDMGFYSCAAQAAVVLRVQVIAVEVPTTVVAPGTNGFGEWAGEALLQVSPGGGVR